MANRVSRAQRHRERAFAQELVEHAVDTLVAARSCLNLDMGNEEITQYLDIMLTEMEVLPGMFEVADDEDKRVPSEAESQLSRRIVDDALKEEATLEARDDRREPPPV